VIPACVFSVLQVYNIANYMLNRTHVAPLIKKLELIELIKFKDKVII